MPARTAPVLDSASGGQQGGAAQSDAPPPEEVISLEGGQQASLQLHPRAKARRGTSRRVCQGRVMGSAGISAVEPAVTEN